MKSHEPAESSQSFERRKQDHIRLAMDPRTQTEGAAGFDFVDLIHEALPDLDFSEVSLKTELLGQKLHSPIYISSMTAGHAHGELINSRLARLSQDQNILMGVGSQRKELTDPDAALEWRKIRSQSPKANLIGNLGIAQVIQSSTDEVRRLVDSLEAAALFVHLNPLQESLQMEGTPQFKGGWTALERLVKALPVPVIAKEVGCGISGTTARKLERAGVAIIDVSGRGGTHWGRLEGYRAPQGSSNYKAAQTFQNWGLSTIESLRLCLENTDKAQIWASGGVRTGLDAAKVLAIGAQAVGVAKPFLEASLQSEEALREVLKQFEHELKIAMFCTGCRDLSELRQKRVWTWK